MGISASAASRFLDLISTVDAAATAESSLSPALSSPVLVSPSSSSSANSTKFTPDKIVCKDFSCGTRQTIPSADARLKPKKSDRSQDNFFGSALSSSFNCLPVTTFPALVLNLNKLF